MSKNIKNKKLFVISALFLFSFLLSINLTSAAPPFIQSSSSIGGYDLKIPQIGTLEQNQDFNFNFHVFNISNGVPIDDSSTDCFLHIYYKTGMQILETEVLHSDTNVVNEWEINILGGNFSELGEYAYLVQCNSSELGGHSSVGIEVTPSGQDMDSSKGLTIIVSVIIMIIVSLVFLFIANKSEKIGAKISFYSLSAITFIMSILYTVVIMQQTLFGFDSIISGIETFWFVIKMLIGIGIFALLIIVVLVLVKAWKIKRGYRDE